MSAVKAISTAIPKWLHFGKRLVTVSSCSPSALSGFKPSSPGNTGSEAHIADLPMQKKKSSRKQPVFHLGNLVTSLPAPSGGRG